MFGTDRDRLRNRWLLLSACGVGLVIAYVDSRPAWDDAGMTACSMTLCAAMFAAISPNRAWRWALAVGIWIPIQAFVRQVSLESLWMFIVLLFPLAGAYAGRAVRRAATATHRSG